MLRMFKTSTFSASFLLGVVVSLTGGGCHSASARQPALQLASGSVAPAVVIASLKEIHVDQGCHILQDQVSGGKGIAGLSLRTDPVVCHLESVNTSNHIEETIRDGVTQRNAVTISEQEYLLQNVTAQPVIFVIEHLVPKGWQVDSDPQPTEMSGSTAVFRVNAEPSQIVRLHVGERHATPIAATGSINN
jgi:hypothetical protein